MWLVFASLSAVLAGVTAVLGKIGVKNIDSNLGTAIRTVVILIFSWLLVFLTGATKGLATLEPKTLLFLILSGLATGCSWLCYFKALQLGDVNKVTPIDKSSTILSMVLAFLLLHEPLTPFKIISIVLIGLGTYLMIEKQRAVKNQHSLSFFEESSRNNNWLFYALGAAFFASITSILGKVGVQGIDSNLGTAIRTIVVLIMAWIVVFVTGKQHDIKRVDRKNLNFLILSGITTGLSWLCYYKALQDGPASIVVPIDKLSILITISFSYFILHEKLTHKSATGLVMIVGGTLLLLV